MTEKREGPGRPPLFETPEAFQEKADEYFAICEAAGERPKVVGLALHMGFCDRRSLYDYCEREGFSHVARKARSRVELSYEHRLDDAACTGAIFALKNMGWSDRPVADEAEKSAAETAREMFEMMAAMDATLGPD